MAELGEQSIPAHVEVGERAAQLRIDHLFTVGKNAHATAVAARQAGLGNVTDFPEIQLAGKAVKTFLRPGDLVLLKGSRSAGMERVGELLKS